MAVCATIASKLGTRHMNVPRRPITAITAIITEKPTSKVGKANFKESGTIVESKVTKPLHVERKLKTNTKGPNGIKAKRSVLQQAMVTARKLNFYSAA
jgi:hypothetical protein